MRNSALSSIDATRERKHSHRSTEKLAPSGAIRLEPRACPLSLLPQFNQLPANRPVKEAFQRGAPFLGSLARCAWDEKIFALRGYSLLEEEINYDTVFDPFAVVEATAQRNYFQEFWEYLGPRLSKNEQKRLLQTLRRHYDKDFRLPDLVAPGALRRCTR